MLRESDLIINVLSPKWLQDNSQVNLEVSLQGNIAHIGRV